MRPVKRAMQRWTDTGAQITFIPRTNQIEYVHFTGETDAGNNTSHDGFRNGARVLLPKSRCGPKTEKSSSQRTQGKDPHQANG